jgi:cell division cycle protein 20 (cofactor of APC complex)
MHHLLTLLLVCHPLSSASQISQNNSIMNAASYESCFDSLAGTPTKKRSASALDTRVGTPQSANRANRGDRFIPNRSAMDLDVSHYELTRGSCSADAENANVNASPAKEEYNSKLAATLMQGNPTSKVLAFKNKPKPCEAAKESSLRVLYTQNREAGFAPKKYTRHIPQAPERILDAPELLDDYYLNLLDWSSTNVLGVALGDSIYLWNASDGTIQQLMQTQGEGSHVTSLSWIGQGNYMAVGTSDHKVQIWDVEKLKQVRSMDGHSARVSSLAWNGPQLSSGGRDSKIIHHDVREQRHKIGMLKGHTQEVCGLKWSPSGNQLASGGNDNLLNIWDDRYASSANQTTDVALHRLDAHRAAVKALAWCPWQRNLLASGGGTADRMIRFWDSSSGACKNEVDTHSQVCALQWSLHDKELVSSHGYSHNQLILWKYPSMVKVAELTGHTSRVLHMAQSPDGQTVVSAAADETLRFWKILGGGADSKKEHKAAATSVLNNAMSIR